MNLQELVARGRLLFAAAPGRRKVFELVNGKRSATEIAKMVRRSPASVRNDLRAMANAELIGPRTGKDGQPTKDQGSLVYEKASLAKTVPMRYFSSPSTVPSQRPQVAPSSRSPRPSQKRVKALPIPTEAEVLDICRAGEDQVYEFKAAGTDMRRITKEIGAMLHTIQGGVILYGVADDGTIEGTDITRQQLDQSLHNSVRNAIAPAVTVKLGEVTVMGSKVMAIIVPPWNRREVYQYEGRVLIRKGTNAFTVAPEELKRLHRGEYII